MRIAIIDVGTNTTRLYIAEVGGGTITKEITRISRVTRLGAGVDASGRLAPSALEREYAVFEEYRARLAETPVEHAIAVMTSAVRDAANGRELAEVARRDYGFDARILSGEQEARLTYLGAVSGNGAGTPPMPTATDPPDARGELTRAVHAQPQLGALAPGGRRNGAGRLTLVVDIGGGSTEVVIGHGSSVEFYVSLQAGVVRHADRHIANDPPTSAELDALAGDVRAALDACIPPARRDGIGRAIGVAGTPTVLAAIAQDLEPYDPDRVHGYLLSALQRDAIFARLRSLPLAQRQQVRGLHPDRANVILPGIVILTQVMSLFGLEAIEVSEHDILHGAALSYAQLAGVSAREAEQRQTSQRPAPS